MTLFQSTSVGFGRDAEQRHPAAGDDGVEQLIEGRRRAAHLERDVEALGHLELAHHVARGLPSTRRPATTSATSAASARRIRVDVGDHHVPRADVARHGAGHDADRPGAGDQHVLADEIVGQRGVDGVAERIEDRADFVVHLIGQRHDVEGRHAHVFGEGAGDVDARCPASRGRGGSARRAPPRLSIPMTWPSPETRWPSFRRFTSAPTSTISPAYSWPIVIGIGIVFCAHSSQL